MTDLIQRSLALGVAGLAFALSACNAKPSPSMATVQLPTIQQMNDLGTRKNLDQSFAYTLTAGCDLQVSKLFNGHPIKQMLIPLSNTGFDRYNYAHGLGYAVRTVSRTGEGDQILFSTSAVESANLMLQLLEKIKLECVGMMTPERRATIQSTNGQY